MQIYKKAKQIIKPNFGIRARLLLLIIFIISSISASVYFYNRYYKNYYLTILAPINYEDGIGRQAIDLVMLLDSKVDLNIQELILSSNSLPNQVKKILRNKNKKLGYVVLNEYPLPISGSSREWSSIKKTNSINNIPREEQIYITYSMLENDKIPEYWVYIINKYFDMVVIPDKNLISSYINAGVTKPIFILPLGVNLTSHLEAPLKTNRNKIFKFANFSTFEDRKNILKLVQAYHKAFKDNQDVRLIFSPRDVYGDYDQKVFNYILENNITGVEIDIGPKAEEFYNFIFGSIDCYVSPSKGEGFSIIPREAMARGIPVIITNSAAQKTIADTGLVKVVPANKLVPATYFNSKYLIGNFFDINVDDLSDAMIDVYNNYSKYLQQSENARTWAESYQYKSFQEEYINMVKPKKIIFGDRNEITKNHLMTNSKSLYNKFMLLKNKNL